LKRSNRLVLLVGVFLAIIAFVAVLVLGPGSPSQETTVPTVAKTVIATANIPLGARITADKVTVEDKPLDGRDVDAFGDVSQVLGKTVREPVVAGAAITARTLTGGQAGQILDIQVPAGKRAMTVRVDQVTGVGTVIKTGDYVDMIVGFPPDAFPVITTNPVDDSFTIVAGLNSRSVKVLLQGMQVLGTLLPPPPAQAQGQEGQPAQGQSGTALTEQQEIVALSVDAQQAEVIKFAQITGEGAISLILRSSEDFLDPATGQPIDPPPLPDPTTGIILKSLVDRYGVLPPELIETVLPAQARR
jgi:pilus assembly protein CpaB